MSFIHDDRDFRQLLNLVTEERRIAPALVEKDYWVTHCMWALHQTGLEVWFKGGTSLSKGYGIIERFSEDLDALSRRYAREAIEPDGFARHYEDMAHIIGSLDRLPAIEQSPRALAADMLREKDIAALPSAD